MLGCNRQVFTPVVVFISGIMSSDRGPAVQEISFEPPTPSKDSEVEERLSFVPTAEESPEKDVKVRPRLSIHTLFGFHGHVKNHLHIYIYIILFCTFILPLLCDCFLKEVYI